MNYVERKVTEEDIQYLSRFAVYLAREYGYGEYLVENKEEKSYMVRTFGQGAMDLEGNYISEIPIISSFTWKDSTIQIENFESSYALEPKKFRSPEGILYSICTIQALTTDQQELQELAKERNKIIQMIQEAFLAWKLTRSGPVDENGRYLKDENGFYIYTRESYVEAKIIHMAEPKNF